MTMPRRYYLDCDTTPARRSHYARAGLGNAKQVAFSHLANVTEGQIGIYETHLGDGFKGYAIKQNGFCYFEETSQEDA